MDYFKKYYIQLTEFKKQFGHCNIVKENTDKKFYSKTINIRSKYSKGILQKDQIQKLEQIGFVWSAREKSWNEFIQVLKEYKSKTGNCNVPQSYEDKWLARKVSGVRASYKYKKLSNKQLTELNSLGFVYNTNDKLFKRFIKRLAKFKKANGHCNVPILYEKDPWLGRRVNSYRIRFSKGNLKKGEVEILDKLGFVWNTYNYSFEQILYRLKEFKKYHGHCNISIKNSNDDLGKMVSSIRTSYKRKTLNEQQIKLLNEVGFIFNTANNSFDRFIGELKEFKKYHGHFNVPRLYNENPWLGHKVSNTRRAFNNGSLNISRIQELEKLGFEWSLRSRVKEK